MPDRFANGDTGNDTGGLPDDRLVSGFDPTHKAFYHGGDLAGLRDRLDYIRGLGTTAIWLTPIFKNKPVHVYGGVPQAAYHGYFVTDFTQVDPHLGTNADLRALVNDAHARGMKVYLDIIVNHTADVVDYREGPGRPYVSKDRAAYRTASGRPFDDRDHASQSSFPPLSPFGSFPYTPTLDPGEANLKVPAWLNDVTLYHNRGDGTFVGEGSLYGDFFGLDDVFTEHPRVVEGMIDIYQSWIADFDVDGFRIDTMKHVNDELWRAFGPRILRFAREHGKRKFFMFGEVFDTSRSFTSHFTTANKIPAVLDFPFQEAARTFASRGGGSEALEAFFAGDDWYTDADSNAYELPTFLGNHDMGRFGAFVQADNPGAGDAEWLARDRLGHELMYLSRGNPIVYYGDEQGFTGTAFDQDARQSMFGTRVADYLDDDLLGTDATHAQANFDPAHPLYRSIARLARATREHPTLRDGAQVHRLASDGVYAFSRVDRERRREYLVALNNTEEPRSAAIPTYVAGGAFKRIYGDGSRAIPSGARSGADRRLSGRDPSSVHSGTDRRLTVTVPPLSAVVYAARGRIPRSAAAPSISLGEPVPAPEARGRMRVAAEVGGSSFYEIDFFAKVGDGRWAPIGVDDAAPYRVFHDVGALAPGTPVSYRATVRDNASHTATSEIRTTSVPLPLVTIETPREGSGVRGAVELRATADPERASHVVSFERSVAGGPWTSIGTDDSSPIYTAFDDLAPLQLAPGTEVRYRATLTEPNGSVARSEERTVRVGGPPAALATLHYFRPGGDYTGWGLHLWGDAVDPIALEQIAWDRPWPLTRIEDGWAEYDVPLVDDTQPVNFIMHLPSGDIVPISREPGGDRSFLPIDTPDVWIKQGDPTVYPSRPPTR